MCNVKCHIKEPDPLWITHLCLTNTSYQVPLLHKRTVPLGEGLLKVLNFSGTAPTLIHAKNVSGRAAFVSSCVMPQ